MTSSRNKYKEYLVDSMHYGNAGKFANDSEKNVVGVPDLFFNIGVKYKLKALSGTYGSVNLQRVGQYYVNDANTITVPSYTILNAGMGIDRLGFENSRVFVSVFVGTNNLTHIKYIGFGSLSLGLNL